MKFLLVGAVIVTTVSAPLVLVANREAPVPGRTGGFGGPTCQACHSGAALNAPGGELVISGLPDRYTPGETYRITLQLKRAEMTRGGFSLAARFASGALSRRQAGEWKAPDARVTFFQDAQTKVPYAQHSAAGSRAATAGMLGWELEWKAPAESEPVQFNLAATAANNDGSPRGDVVYTREITVAPSLR